MATAKAKPDVDVFEELQLPQFQVAGTPYERLRQVFKIRNDLGIRSFELEAAWYSSVISCGCGFFVGSARMAQAADQTWRKTHYHSVFLNRTDYTRYYMNYMARRGVIDGAKFGLRTGFMGGILALTVGCLAAARDKARITDIGIAGILASFLYRIDTGPRAVMASGIIGGVFWQFLGFMLVPGLRAFGYTFDEFYKAARNEYYEETIAMEKFSKEMQEVAQEEGLWPWQVKRRWAEKKLEDEERLATLRKNTLMAQTSKAVAPVQK